MPDLSFEVLGAQPARDMITPALEFDLRVTNRFPEEAIQAVLLRCQIQIEVARRKYTADEQQQLRELFDEPSRWGDTLRPMTWLNTSLNLPAFCGSLAYPLVVPCTFDFKEATAKYFHGIAEGEVPLSFLFSGTVFHDTGQRVLQAAPISWNKEARFRMPVAEWKRLLDQYHPNVVSLNLRRDVFEELYRFKMQAGLATFDEAIQKMLERAEAERPVS
jgi:Family of unknown function (DUF6084)